MTWAPASTRRRQTLDRLVGGDAPRHAEDDALALEHGVGVSAAYSADSVSSPSASSSSASGSGPVAEDLVGVDLLEGDRQRLAGRGGDLRRHHGAEALGQLVVVRVDLPGPLGAEGDQGELRASPVEEALDGRVHHRVVARRHGRSSSFAEGGQSDATSDPRRGVNQPAATRASDLLRQVLVPCGPWSRASQVVGGAVVEVDVVDRLVAGPFEVAALGVVDEGLGQIGAVAVGHPLGSHLGGALDPHPEGGQPGSGRQPAGQARLEDAVALGGPGSEAVVELAVDLRVALGVGPELGQGHPRFSGHLPEHLAARDALEPEPRPRRAARPWWCRSPGGRRW